MSEPTTFRSSIDGAALVLVSVPDLRLAREIECATKTLSLMELEARWRGFSVCAVCMNLLPEVQDGECVDCRH